MQRPETFLAQDGFVLTSATPFSDVDQTIAINLYQPLIGPEALSLYLSLWQEVKRDATETKRQPQTVLMDLLNISLDTLFVARTRLEAVGLLRTYTDTDQASRYYAYELYAPASATDFFADSLLSLALYEKVGETRYEQLRDRFSNRPVTRRSWQNISASFLDVFALRHDASEPPAAVTTATSQTAAKPMPTPNLGDSGSYDWQLLASLLTHTNLLADQLDRYRPALFDIAKFYGLQPTQFAKLITRATDVMTGKLDLRQLRRFAEATYHVKTVAKLPKTAVQQGDSELLVRAKTQPLRAFLDATKKAKDSRMFAADNEVRALSKLQQRGIFDDATINILVDYILQTNDSINQALLDTIANAWLKAHVDSPESALAQIQTYQKQSPKKVTKRRYQGQGQRKQEQLPDWAQPGYEAQPTPVNDSDQAKLAAQRAALEALNQPKGSEHA